MASTTGGTNVILQLEYILQLNKLMKMENWQETENKYVQDLQSILSVLPLLLNRVNYHKSHFFKFKYD